MEDFKKKLMKKCGKHYVLVNVCKMKKNTYFVIFLNASSILNKVSISNFVKFRLQSMSFKIERVFEKITKFSIKIEPKRTLIRQLNGP